LVAAPKALLCVLRASAVNGPYETIDNEQF
jgi:hypothetical protein